MGMLSGVCVFVRRLFLCRVCFVFFFFFFSSRRRHTRYIGDWSSDVCSSDLVEGALQSLTVVLERRFGLLQRDVAPVHQALHVELSYRTVLFDAPVHQRHGVRSEERRVGKECRFRWSWEHQKKKKNERDVNGK